MNINPTQIAALGQWFAGHDTGVSSETMAAISMGATSGYFAPPWDNSDFGRCYRLVEKCPFVRDAFQQIATLVPAFSPIIQRWDDLAAMYVKDPCNRELFDLLAKLTREKQL